MKKEIQLPEQSEELLNEYDKIISALEKLNYEKTGIVNKLKDFLDENERGVVRDRAVKWSKAGSMQLSSVPNMRSIFRKRKSG